MIGAESNVVKEISLREVKQMCPNLELFVHIRIRLYLVEGADGRFLFGNGKKGWAGGGRGERWNLIATRRFPYNMKS